MRLAEIISSLREWTRRFWGALGGRRDDDDLQCELAAHLALAEDELRRRGEAPNDAARLARAAAGGHVQALEALRAQRGLPWLGSSWLDVRLGLRLLVKNWGLTLVGGLATTLAIVIAAVVFATFDVVLWSRLPLDEGERVVAIQVWDREAGRRRDTTWQDVERWREILQSVVDVGVFQTTQRNTITADGSVELATVAEISSAGFRVARVAPLIGRAISEVGVAPTWRGTVGFRRNRGQGRADRDAQRPAARIPNAVQLGRARVSRPLSSARGCGPPTQRRRRHSRSRTRLSLTATSLRRSRPAATRSAIVSGMCAQRAANRRKGRGRIAGMRSSGSPAICP